MPWTRFPNGVSASTTQTASLPAVSDGKLFGDSVIGHTVVIPVSFGTGSAAQSAVAPVPFTGQVVGAIVGIGSVGSIVAPYTIRIGSAGTVVVASVNNTSGVAYSNQDLGSPTTPVDVPSGSALQAVRGAQGTAGDSTLGILFRRTA